MIIKGVVVDSEVEMDDKMISVISEFMDDEGISGEVENEALAALDSNAQRIKIQGDEDEFFVNHYTTFTADYPNTEHRFVEEHSLDKVFENEVEEYYDLEQWKQAVESDSTEDGYEEWQQSIKDDAQYGELLGSHDGCQNEIQNYSYFRVN